MSNVNTFLKNNRQLYSWRLFLFNEFLVGIVAEKQVLFAMAIGGENDFFAGSQPLIQDAFGGIGFGGVTPGHSAGVHLQISRGIQQGG